MREINYQESWKELLTPEIVSLLTKIHEFKGEQTLFVETHADELEHLMEVAKIQSIESSNRIEDIYTSDERLKLIALDKTMPKTRDEFEIAGYRDVLNAIHVNYEHIPIRPSFILQLHRDLYKFVRFQPVLAWETPEMMEKLCTEFDEICKNEVADPLLIIPMFILDFLCIRPFNDGNGRMSRLLTLLLLFRSGYIVGKYISIEKLIEISKDVYDEAIYESSYLWHEQKNNYEPFVRYILGVVLNAYREFSSGVKLMITSNLSKPERVREVIKDTLGTITKAEIAKKCPDISQITIQRALAELLASGEITKIGGGRYTKYTWNWSKGDN